MINKHIQLLNPIKLTIMKKIAIKLFFTATIFLVVAGCWNQKSEYEKMVGFGEKYTEAWNSKNPEKMDP